MTRALYHEDTVCLSFGARVQAVREDAGTSEVLLDATAFYPEGGGQGADHGVLRWDGGEVRVTDTRRDRASGEIWHRVGGRPPAPGSDVTGMVDAARRWRHMQRHSGEHLLAQAFVQISPAFTVEAVNMTRPECTLDLRGDPTEHDVRAAERLLRETLARTRLTLETPSVPEDQLGAYPLRRETKVRGQVRLVIFRREGGQPFDVSACGGTHVPHASLAAPVVALRTERIRGGVTRVTFMAGEEAAEYLAGVYRAARALAQDFSVPVEGLPDRVAAVNAELGAAKAETARLRETLARALVAAAPADERGLLTLTLEDPALLAPALAAVPDGAVLAALAPGGRCGVASGRSGMHAGEILRAALGVTGGKGGGRAELAQGVAGEPAWFLAAVGGALARVGEATG